MDRHNNYVGYLSIMSNVVKIFDILVLHNYFDGLTKFRDPYLAKFLNTLRKPFFLCINEKRSFH